METLKAKLERGALGCCRRHHRRRPPLRRLHVLRLLVHRARLADLCREREEQGAGDICPQRQLNSCIVQVKEIS